MKRILVRGPALSRSGYGEHTRLVLRSLRSSEEYDIYLICVGWGATGWLYENNEEREWIDSLIEKTNKILKFHQEASTNFIADVSLQVTIPGEWEPLAKVNIGCTAGIETTKIHSSWVEKSQLMDRIQVVSKHAKYAFDNTVYLAVNEETGERIENFKCRVPIDVINYPAEKMEIKELENFEPEAEFNFLTMAQWSPRKNLEATIKWFVEEFFDNPNVGLIVKTSLRNNSVIDKYYTEERITELLSQYDNRECKIQLLHGDLLESEIQYLYQHPKIKSLISLSHGEGYGLPLFEAAQNSLPVIAPNWGGLCDFMHAKVKTKKKNKEKVKPFFAKVDYSIGPIQPQAVWDGVLIKESKWCFPKEGSYKMKLRMVYKNWKQFKKQAETLKREIMKNFKKEKIYQQYIDCVEAACEKLPEDSFRSNEPIIMEL